MHSWIFTAALSLRGIGLSDETQIAGIIEERATRRDAQEIADAVRNSAQIAGGKSSLSRYDGRMRVAKTLPKTEVNLEAIEAISEKFGGCIELREASPADVTLWTTEDLLDALFPGNPLLCLARRKNVFETLPREQFRGRETEFSLIVPSPMSARMGTTRQGKPSARCLGNTGPRRFLVIESDMGTLDEQAAILLCLARTFPLVLVAHSGGKSLHGWFYCLGQDEETLRRFHRIACELGADPSTWTQCQLVRLPGAVRDTGVFQEVLFLNPAACPSFPPQGYCVRCWNTHRAIPLGSRFPCHHQGGMLRDA